MAKKPKKLPELDWLAPRMSASRVVSLASFIALAVLLTVNTLFFADLHGAGPGGPSTLLGFRGFGRHGEEHGDGSYAILTVKPGRVPIAVAGGGEVLQAPHVDVSLFARGLLDRVVTRIYFADEAEANAGDPVLQSVPEDRRDTLLAQPDGDGGYVFDLRLQGDGETVFFAV